MSVTPPGGGYAIEKYLGLESLPFPVHDRLYEVRLLTAVPGRRRGVHGALLMLAALRWIEERGGTHVVCIGRREILRLYLRAGLHGTGIQIRAGAVTYEVLHAGVGELSRRASQQARLLRRIERTVEWNLDAPVRRPPACFHGGAFFEAIGEGFASLGRRRRAPRGPRPFG